MEIKPGESITEFELQKLLNIGRTPIREALTRLESEGLIYSNKGRKRVYKLTTDEIVQIFDIKCELEGAIVRWAAERGTDKQKRSLVEIVEKMDKLGENRPGDATERNVLLKSWIALDKKLHQIIFDMANVPKATQYIEKLNLQWHRMRISIYILEGRISKSANEHQQFVSHIINGKPAKAEASMKRHLKNLKAEILDFMKLYSYQY